MRFRYKSSRVIISLLLMFSALFSLSIPAYAANYGECAYDASTYQNGSCTTTTTTADSTLTDTGDSSLYIGIGALMLSIAAVATIVLKRKPHPSSPDKTKTDL